MKKVLIIAVMLALLVPSMIFAEGIANTFSVDYVRISSDGRGFVFFTSDLDGTPPSCTETNYANSLAFDTSTTGGKAIYALVLTAKASGKKVYAKGTGTCTVYTLAENWSWGRIEE